MPPRPPGRLLLLPRGLEQATLRQPDQDRVQRARLQPGPFRDVVPVPPLRRRVGQRSQDREGLGRTTFHHGGELYLGRVRGSLLPSDRHWTAIPRLRASSASSSDRPASTSRARVCWPSAGTSPILASTSANVTGGSRA